MIQRIQPHNFNLFIDAFIKGSTRINYRGILAVEFLFKLPVAGIISCRIVMIPRNAIHRYIAKLTKQPQQYFILLLVTSVSNITHDQNQVNALQFLKRQLDILRFVK